MLKDEQNKRLAVLIVIKAKGFKEERTEKGRTAARMKKSQKGRRKWSLKEAILGKIRGET